MYIEPSSVRYDRVIKPVYERKLKAAKNHAKKMNKYLSKMDAIDANMSVWCVKGTGAIVGNLLKFMLSAIVAKYWQGRVHKCANRVKRLADRNTDFWTGSGGDYYKEIMMLDPDYEAKEYERKCRQKDGYTGHGDGGYDTSFLPY